MKYFPFFILLAFLFSCGNSSSENNDGQSSNPSTEASAKPTSARPDVPLEKPDIKIKLEGLNQGLCFLIGTFTDQHYKADSAQVNAEGIIHFNAAEPYKPGFYYLMLPDNSTQVQIIIDADQTFSMTASRSNPVLTMKVEGSLDNQLLYETMMFEYNQRPKFQQVANQMKSVPAGSAQYQELKAQQDALGEERRAYLNKIFTEHAGTLFASFKEAGQNPSFETIKKPDGTLDTAKQVWTYRTRFWENVDFNDERLLWTPVIANKLKRYINELTPQNPDSIRVAASFLVDQVLDKPEYFKFFANWITLNYEPTKTTLMDSEAVFVHMIENYFTYERAFWSDSVEVHGLQLRAYEMSASLVGKKGPNVTANDPSGTPRSIYDLKSPYILVYMWNPECEHCAEQTPKLVQNYNNWKSQGVDVFGIAVNTEDAAWRRAIKSYGMPWTNVYDPTNKSIYAKYFVDNTPELYVLNPDRTIIGKNLQWDQVMTVVNRDKAKRG